MNEQPTWQNQRNQQIPQTGAQPWQSAAAAPYAPDVPPQPSAVQPSVAPIVHRAPARRRVWPGVVAASLASAALASAGTVGILAGTGAFEQDPPAATTTATAVQASSDQRTGADVAAVADAVADSVVSIHMTSRAGSGMGSGVIIDAAGHILTNNHVVSGASQLTVSLSDGRVFEARVVGTDPTTDLAVIALASPPEDLVVAAFGDSDAVTVGEEVVAIGNPLGLSATVTSGIVSALDRPVTTQGEGPNSTVVTNAIQVDAAINPGNSGGPLFDHEGQVIGINSSIASMPSAGGSSSGSIGLGFAIPSNLAQRIADELVTSGTAAHSFLGVSLTTGTAETDGGARMGAEIVEVVRGAAAEAAGLRVGDVVVAIDGEPVTGADSLTGHVRENEPGTQVTLDVVRGGETHQVAVTLGTSE